MAAGLPIVSTDVGDVRSMVSSENTRYIAPVYDEGVFTAALGHLVSDRKLRAALGKANRETAIAEYDETAMINRYAALYGLQN